MLSFSSIDEVTQSLSDDLINPTMSRANNMREDQEVTHWHSTPLAFAILPAIGGVLFKNGSAFITDILLLGLAAIFMNWSVRLPWDWYYSAQAQLRAAEPVYDDMLEEVEADETAVESASSAGNSPKNSTQPSPTREPQSAIQKTEKREAAAAAELRRQELFALLATYAFPVLAAYLLHTVREQLSSSSTALVSDFNLTIFVLAAEIRPFQQLIRLVRKRTLHLQRVVTGLNDPFGAAVEESDAIRNVTSRVTELEAKLAEQSAAVPNGKVADMTETAELITAEVRKRTESRFDALERAMRRYEKRSTTLNMLIEQRLNTHESRIQDSVSLAAAAAAQQASNRGIIARGMEHISNLIAAAMKLPLSVLTSPFLIINAVYNRLKELLLGPTPAKPAKRSTSRHGGGLKDERARDKGPSRKPIR